MTCGRSVESSSGAGDYTKPTALPTVTQTDKISTAHA
jgi:hypothetical protein